MIVKKYFSFLLVFAVSILFAQEDLVENVVFPNPDAAVTMFLKDNSIYGENNFNGPVKNITIKVKHLDNGDLTSKSNIDMFYSLKSKLEKVINKETLYTGIEPCNCADEEDKSTVEFVDTTFYTIGSLKNIKNVKPTAIDTLTGALELKPNHWYKNKLLVQKIKDDAKTVYVYDDKKRLIEEHSYIRDILESEDENNPAMVTAFYKNYMAKAKYNEKDQIVEVKSYSSFQNEFYFSHIVYNYNKTNQLIDYKKTTRDYYNITINDQEDLDNQSWFELTDYVSGIVTQNWVYKDDKLMQSIYKSSSDDTVYTQDYSYNNNTIIINEFNTSFSFYDNKTEEYNSKSIYKYDEHNNLVSYKYINIEEGKDILVTDAILKITYY